MTVVVAVIVAALVAAGNFVALRALVPDPFAGCLPCVAWLVASPLVAAVLTAFVRPSPLPAPVVTQAPPAESPADPALRLLGALQEAGRFVDFLEEDLAPYPDDQIGAAARGIHEGCRKALHERVTLEPVMPGAEGDSVTVEAGFDPAAVRLTGSVTGSPPFRGVLRHAGWRVVSATIPIRAGQDVRVIAPAEVEIS